MVVNSWVSLLPPTYPGRNCRNLQPGTDADNKRVPRRACSQPKDWGESGLNTKHHSKHKAVPTLLQPNRNWKSTPSRLWSQWDQAGHWSACPTQQNPLVIQFPATLVSAPPPSIGETWRVCARQTVSPSFTPPSESVWPNDKLSFTLTQQQQSSLRQPSVSPPWWQQSPAGGWSYTLNQRQQNGASWCPTFTGQVSVGPSKKLKIHTHPDLVLYLNRTACQKWWLNKIQSLIISKVSAVWYRITHYT